MNHYCLASSVWLRARRRVYNRRLVVGSTREQCSNREVGEDSELPPRRRKASVCILLCVTGKRTQSPGLFVGFRAGGRI